MRRRRAMVLHGLLHYLYLLWREPLAKAHVGGEDLASRDVMYGARTFHAEVMIGRYDIGHVNIGTKHVGKLKRILDHSLRVGDAMRTSKGIVTRQYLLFHKTHYVKTDIHRRNLIYKVVAS